MQTFLRKLNALKTLTYLRMHFLNCVRATQKLLRNCFVKLKKHVARMARVR